MRRTILLGLLALSGCQYVPGTEAHMEHQARDAFTGKILDASSAQFRDLWSVDVGAEHIICGQMNAKNAFGAYAGFKNFVVSTKDGFAVYDPEVSSLSGDSERAIQMRAWKDGFAAIWPNCEKGRKV